ncbi:MAG TPA: type II toxin-antitoxin system Phd/YefM family antitoxin [Pyrinomonadaceae bacterium]
MKILEDIHPLSEFKKNASKLIKQVQSTKRPMILTLNGKPAAVLQDPSAFQASASRKDYLETIEALRRAYDDIENSDNWMTLDDAFDELRVKHLGQKRVAK